LYPQKGSTWVTLPRKKGFPHEEKPQAWGEGKKHLTNSGLQGGGFSWEKGIAKGGKRKKKYYQKEGRNLKPWDSFNGEQGNSRHQGDGLLSKREKRNRRRRVSTSLKKKKGYPAGGSLNLGSQRNRKEGRGPSLLGEKHERERGRFSSVSPQSGKGCISVGGT